LVYELRKFGNLQTMYIMLLFAPSNILVKQH
jgi:hypothetical protein